MSIPGVAIVVCGSAARDSAAHSTAGALAVPGLLDVIRLDRDGLVQLLDSTFEAFVIAPPETHFLRPLGIDDVRGPSRPALLASEFRELVSLAPGSTWLAEARERMAQARGLVPWVDHRDLLPSPVSFLTRHDVTALVHASDASVGVRAALDSGSVDPPSLALVLAALEGTLNQRLAEPIALDLREPEIRAAWALRGADRDSLARGFAATIGPPELPPGRRVLAAQPKGALIRGAVGRAFRRAPRARRALGL